MLCETHSSILNLLWFIIKKFTERSKKTYKSILLGGPAQPTMKQPVTTITIVITTQKPQA